VAFEWYYFVLAIDIQRGGKMDFGTAISTGFAKYINFSDRACRSEYWYWMLFAVIFAVMGNIGNYMLHTQLVNLLVGLPFIIPGWAVSIRRLHDTDRSGWWSLIAAIPLIGVVLLVWFATQGTQGPNRFGPDPLDANPSPGQPFGAPA
jgi:uncharacterized membrane protein YhaH (DUF805 family)